MQTHYEFENNLQEEEMKQLKKREMELEETANNKSKEIKRLHMQLTNKNTECRQLMECNNDYLMRIAKHIKTGIPYCNRSMECLAIRLKMPQFTYITLQPLFEACPEVELIIAEKARKGFYEGMIELQNFLMICDFQELHKGLVVTQEYFFYQGQAAGFLKAQINMTQCTLPSDMIIRLFDYGMVDHIIFNKPEEVLIFGKKMQLVIGNILVSETVQAQIYSFPPKSYGIIEEAAKNEVFVVPLGLANFYSNKPKDINFMDTIEYYVFLEQERRKCYQLFWANFNLLTQGRTIQIQGPSKWKIRIPFDGEEHTIREQDIFEGTKRDRCPIFNNRQNDLPKIEENDEGEDEDDLYQEENDLYIDDDDMEENEEEEYATDSQNDDEE